MELLDYVRILRKNWLLITSASLLGAFAGGAVAATTTPQYTASTRLYVSVRASDTAVSQDLNQGTTFARQAVTTYADVISSAIVLDKVVAELDLPQSSAELAGSVRASSPSGTSLIDIAVTDPDPRRAADIANAAGETFREVLAEELEKPTGGGESLVNVKTIQPAAAPSKPSAPNSPLLILGGLIAGLAGGIAVSVARSLLDTRIRTVRELEAISRKPFLGGILTDPEAPKRPLVVHAEPQSVRAESFRRLRTSLQFLTVPGGRRTFVVTSSRPSEGKSNVAANLAIAIAETGARVVLVDGDLRRPTVDRNFVLEGGAGLTDLLIGRAELDDVIQPWGTNGLAILPSGRIPPNPSELLGSEAMTHTISELEARFEYVIIDAPPLLLVSDAAVLSSAAAGVLLVSASGRVRRADLTGAMRILEGVKADVLGVIATMLPLRGPDADAYGDYSYAEYTASSGEPSRRRGRFGRKRASDRRAAGRAGRAGRVERVGGARGAGAAGRVGRAATRTGRTA
ncbi:polysaccharide biosynthesis tyrosine autokinase [Leifsonia sp. AG29]|uniref:polysaccharide biosynthesis tyrosine autokinase n=1 Tax=Leifsonia sp. AG29 TaxID=2598860 RepID=UPI00131E0DA2|nr:polysaccharide biosynthesis tyrosine autokinase [Leifsonia sp. AG29]